MGNDTHHGTFKCNYCNLTNTKHIGLEKNRNRVRMRLATTIYIGEFVQREL